MRLVRSTLLPLLLLTTSLALAVPPAPAAFAGHHEASADDRAAIEALLGA
jgi:hypothetical protein